jgi:hypothetical protein
MRVTQTLRADAAAWILIVEIRCKLRIMRALCKIRDRPVARVDGEGAVGRDRHLPSVADDPARTCRSVLCRRRSASSGGPSSKNSGGIPASNSGVRGAHRLPSLHSMQASRCCSSVIFDVISPPVSRPGARHRANHSRAYELRAPIRPAEAPEHLPGKHGKPGKHGQKRFRSAPAGHAAVASVTSRQPGERSVSDQRVGACEDDRWAVASTRPPRRPGNVPGPAPD